MGFTLIFIARIISIIYSLIEYPDLLYIGGLVSSNNAFKYSYPILIAGTIINSSTILIHSYRKPLIYRESKINLKKCIEKIYGKKYLLKKLIFPIGFLIGFTIRMLPEIYMWPRPIGYDTIIYIAHLKDFMVNPKLFTPYVCGGSSLRNIPPLLDWITYPFTFLIDPWYIFKLYPPIMYGILIGLIGLYSHRVLKLDIKWTLLTIVASTFNLLLLRLSWDLHKQFLATTIFLLAAIILENKDEHIVVGILLILSSLASEIGVMFTIILSIIVIIRKILEKSFRKTYPIITYTLIIIISYTLYSWYMRKPIKSNPVLGISPPTVGINRDIGIAISYIIAGAGLIIPLYFIGYREALNKAKYSTTYSLILFLTTLTPWLTPYTDVTALEYDRLLMSFMSIAIPISFLAVRKIYSKTLTTILLILLITPGIYSTIHPTLKKYNIPLVYSMKRMPSYMVSSPDNLNEFDELMDIAKYTVKIYMENNTIVTSYPYMRFIRLYIRNPDINRLTATGWKIGPEEILTIAIRKNLTKIYLLHPSTVNLTSKTLETELNTFIKAIKNKTFQQISKIKVKEIYSNKYFTLFQIILKK